MAYLFKKANVTETVNVRFPYRIVAVIRTGDSANISALLQASLQDDLAQYHYSQRVISRSLSRISIELFCSISERAVLVHLVNCLGLQKSVRNVRWESITEKAYLAPVDSRSAYAGSIAATAN